MTFIPTQTDRAPVASFGTDFPGPRRSEQLAMFCVTGYGEPPQMASKKVQGVAMSDFLRHVSQGDPVAAD